MIGTHDEKAGDAVDKTPLLGGDDDPVALVESVETKEWSTPRRPVASNPHIPDLARERRAPVVPRPHFQMRSVGALNDDLV